MQCHRRKNRLLPEKHSYWRPEGQHVSRNSDGWLQISVLAAVSPVARTSPAPLVGVSLCARGALVGARALALAFTLCFITGSDLCTSGLALEAVFASLRLVRREPERLVDGFLR